MLSAVASAASELRRSIRLLSKYSVSGKAGKGAETEGAVGEFGGVLEGVVNEEEVVRGGLKTRSTSPRTTER